MPRLSFFNDRILIVPAGKQSDAIHMGGTLLEIFECTAPFDVEFDDWGKNSGRAGLQIDTGEARFRQVTFYNRSSAAPLMVEFGVGLGSGRAGVRYSYNRVPAVITRAKAMTLAIGASAIFPGISPASDTPVNVDGSTNDHNAWGIPPQSSRRHIIVSNANNANVLEVRAIKPDATLIVGSYVQPNSSLPIEGAALIQVKNPAGSTAAVTCATLETFYAQ